MKKIIFLVAILLAYTISAQDKPFSIGVNAGIPIGNLEDNFSVAFGLDLNYVYSISNTIDVGASTGVIYFSGEENSGITPEGKTYIPIAAAFRFSADTDRFFVGGDFGFAVGVSPDGDRGGFYFKPILGYKISESFSLNGFYTGIKKEHPTYSYVGLGLMFKI